MSFLHHRRLRLLETDSAASAAAEGVVAAVGPFWLVLSSIDDLNGTRYCKHASGLTPDDGNK